MFSWSFPCHSTYAQAWDIFPLRYVVSVRTHCQKLRVQRYAGEVASSPVIALATMRHNETSSTSFMIRNFVTKQVPTSQSRNDVTTSRAKRMEEQRIEDDGLYKQAAQ